MFNRRWDDAVALLTSVNERFPNNADVQSRLERSERNQRLATVDAQAREAESAGRWRDAVDTLEILAVADPGYPDVGPTTGRGQAGAADRGASRRASRAVQRRRMGWCHRRKPAHRGAGPVPRRPRRTRGRRPRAARGLAGGGHVRGGSPPSGRRRVRSSRRRLRARPHPGGELPGYGRPARRCTSTAGAGDLATASGGRRGER